MFFDLKRDLIFLQRLEDFYILIKTFNKLLTTYKKNKNIEIAQKND